jgi:hypothetical protein
MSVEQKDVADRIAEQAAKASGEDDDHAVFETYSPQKMKVKDASPHKADLVQSLALASVEPPDVTYTPRLPKKMIEEGRLSEAQIEAVTYAGQAFEGKNADGTTRGFFIGDGTGVGKGREISGIITDQMARGHGDGKAVWITKNDKLAEDALRDWTDIGNDPKTMFSKKGNFEDQKKPVARDKGVMLTTYPLLNPRKGDKSRFNQITAWLGKDYDGVIVLDEAHIANNVVDETADGKPKTSWEILGPAFFFGIHMEQVIKKGSR